MNATQVAEAANKILRRRRCKAHAHEFAEMSMSLEMSETQVAVSVDTRDMPKDLRKWLRLRDYNSKQAYEKATMNQRKNRVAYNNKHMDKAIKALEGSVRIRRKVDSRGFIELLIK